MFSLNYLGSLKSASVFLAPMEGVVDWVMRDVLTSLGGIDVCVTEFLRVTDHVHRDSVFFDYCPELKTNAQTRAGTPVIFQLLGGKKDPLVANALRAVALGAKGIDLNFGCPAKTVNRHDGGAALLQYPERIYEITQALRQALPPEISLSVKMRLGYLDTLLFYENAWAAYQGGANWLTVHARTKLNAYQPPAHWHYLADLSEALPIPLIGNGDIFSPEDFVRCRELTGLEHFMIGRGAIRNPFLFLQLKDAGFMPNLLDVHRIVLEFFRASVLFRSQSFAVARTKQFLVYLKQQFPSLEEVFQQLKAITDPVLFAKELQKQLHDSDGVCKPGIFIGE